MRKANNFVTRHFLESFKHNFRTQGLSTICCNCLMISGWEQQSVSDPDFWYQKSRNDYQELTVGDKTFLKLRKSQLLIYLKKVTSLAISEYILSCYSCEELAVNYYFDATHIKWRCCNLLVVTETRTHIWIKLP